MRCILYSNQDEENRDSAVGEEEGKDAGIREDEEDLDPMTIHESLPLPCKSDLLFPFALWTPFKKNQEKHQKHKIHHCFLL